MGEPKLLLPWRNSTIIDHVLHAWCGSRVSRVIVVIRGSDQALHGLCERWHVEIVRPQTDPRDMKESIQFGLRHIEATHEPLASDRWLVAPADLPELRIDVINALVGLAVPATTIAVTRFGQRAGHPVSFPWFLAPKAFQLGETEGIDRIVARHPQVFVDFPAEKAISDIDTPEDYKHHLSRFMLDESGRSGLSS